MNLPAGRHDDAERDRIVHRVQQAYADGRLGFAEMEERVERALTAVTQGDLAQAVVDLPDPPEEEVVLLRSTGGRIRRSGDWQVPRVLRIESDYGGVHLDLSAAVIEYAEIGIELRLAYGSATIVLPAGATANVDQARTEWGRVVCKAPGRPRPGRPHVQIAGELAYGHLRVRHPRGLVR